jgi:hypothetical protein
MSMDKTRLAAQVRLNMGKFRWRAENHELIQEAKCKLCNINEEEDLFHFLCNCKIHNPTAYTYYTNLACNQVNRQNLLQLISNFAKSELESLVGYCIVALNRGKLFFELSEQYKD